MSPLGSGWGTITFYLNHDNQLICDNELMDEEFISQAMAFFIQQATFKD